MTRYILNIVGHFFQETQDIWHYQYPQIKPPLQYYRLYSTLYIVV